LRCGRAPASLLRPGKEAGRRSDVFEHLLRGAVRVAGGDRGDDPLMCRLRHSPARLALGGRAPRRVERVHEALDKSRQEIVARCPGDRLMELGVERDPSLDIASRSLEGAREASDLLDVGRGCPLGSSRRDRRLDRLAEVKQLGRLPVAQVEARDDRPGEERVRRDLDVRAAAGPPRDETLHFQLGDRLAHRAP
jgi:hypothetical protein